jgi:hypothetical protein
MTIPSFVTAKSDVSFISTPKFVGYWIIAGHYGIRVAQVKRPRWLTRFLCRVLLEWEWRDGELPGSGT